MQRKLQKVLLLAFVVCFSLVHPLELIEALDADDDCRGEDCAMYALQTSPVPDVRLRELTVNLTSIANRISDVTDNLVRSISDDVGLGYSQDWNSTGLFDVSSHVRQLIDDIIPRFTDSFNETSAMNPDPKLLGNAKELQTFLFRMQAFAFRHAAFACRQAEASTRNAAVVEDEDIKEIQTAMHFLRTALRFAWTGVKVQLQEVATISTDPTKSVQQKNNVKKATCAADFASSLGSLTMLFLDLESAYSACDSTNSTMFDTVECASSFVSGLGRVAATVSQGSTLMWNCFDSYWGCSQMMSGSLSNLLSAVKSSLTMSSTCNSNSEGICEAFAFSTMGYLAQASGYMRAAAKRCRVKEDIDSAKPREYLRLEKM